jgi:hypothetical protein
MSTTAIQNDLQVGTGNRQILKIALPISLAILVPQINLITNNIFWATIAVNRLRL